jgi:monoamine oxidase
LNGVTLGAPGDLDVLVVGAGFAGLAAAGRLVAAGRKVLVLEGRDRVGGRALTDYRLGDGIPLELGAQMVHGRGAITHQWLARRGLTARPWPVAQRARFVLDRKVARYPWLALPFHPVIGARATYDGLRAIPRDLAAMAPPDRSLAEYLERATTGPAARLWVSLLHAHTYAADPDAIGIRGPAAEERIAEEPFGFRNFRVREGYSALAEREAATLGDRIRLGSPVTAIRATPRDVRVDVRTREGDEVEYAAARVVVTVPLGVLQSGAIAFEPALPPEKVEAIARIGFADGFALQMRLAGGTARRRLGDYALVWGGTPSSFLRPRVGWGEPTEFVTAFTVGREARRRAGLADPELLAATVDEWEGILPADVTLGRVEGIAVHRWPYDPFARGVYSFLPPGAGLEDRAALAAPVGDRLFFAGEATDCTGRSATVPGAIASGLRAADEILAGPDPTSPVELSRP